MLQPITRLLCRQMLSDGQRQVILLNETTRRHHIVWRVEAESDERALDRGFGLLLVRDGKITSELFNREFQLPSFRQLRWTCRR